MNKNLSNIAVGVLLGLLIAWLLGLFSPVSTLPAEPVAQTAAAPPPAQPAAPAPVANTPPASPVATPATRPSKALTTEQSKVVSASVPSDAQVSQIRQQIRLKAMTNNLRQLSTAAQQYMLDKGVTAAGYYDLVGTGTDNYLRNIAPVMGEDYSGVYITQTDTEIMIVAPDGTTATYDQ